MAKNEDDSNRTRATLLDRLKNWEDQSSWQEFFDIYWKLIYRFARKAGLTDAEAQDVVQDTLVAVAKHMPTFKYDPTVGSFKAWLLNLTRWRIVDQFRKRGPIAPHSPDAGDTSRTATVERVPDEKSPDWESLWETDWQQTVFEAAMNRVRRQLDPQKFQIFDFYVNHEWPPDKVAQAFNVAVNQVYLVKNRVTEMLREEVRRLEMEVT